MSDNAPGLSPQAASISCSDLASYNRSASSAKDINATPDRQKSATKTKATRPVKRLRRTSARAPPVESSSDRGDESGEWFAIRDIVDEKVDRGVRQYLVDWEDHPVTGEVYQKSWIPASDANEEAVLHWQAIKQARKLGNEAKATLKLRTKVAEPKAAANIVQPAVASPFETRSAPLPAVDSHGSLVESFGALISNESQALSPLSASSSPPRNPTRKRLAPTTDKNSEERPDSEENADNVVQTSRKRRLVRGIRSDFEHDQKAGKSSSQSIHSISIKSSDSGNRQYSQNSEKQSQSQPLPSSPPATREQSIASPTSLTDAAEVAEAADHIESGNFAVPDNSIGVIANPGFNPDRYARFTQDGELSQITQDSLQNHVWLHSQPLVSGHDRQIGHHSLQTFVRNDSLDLDGPVSSSSSIHDPNLPHHESGYTIPDSQQEDDTQPVSVGQPAVSKVDDSKDDNDKCNKDSIDQRSQASSAGKTTDKRCLPQPDIASTTASTNAIASSHSITSGDAQLVPVPVGSQNDQQLRESADWVSQDEPHSSTSSIEFLTQPDIDFALFTQPSQQSEPSRDRRSSRPIAGKTPAASSVTVSNDFSAVSIVPDSTRAIRAPTLPPRLRTSSPCPSHLAYLATMSESSARPRPASAVEALQQALQGLHETPNKKSIAGDAGPTGFGGISGVDDPLLLAEIQRMQQCDDNITSMDDPAVLAEIQRLEQESQDATASSAEDPLLLAEIQRLQGNSPGPMLPVSQEDSPSSSSSNILRLSLSTAPPVDSTLALSTEPGLSSDLQSLNPLLSAADTGLSGAGPGGNVLLGQDSTFDPREQRTGSAVSGLGENHVPVSTVSMSDLSYAALPMLDLSSELDVEVEGLAGAQNSSEQLSSPLSMEEDADNQVSQAVFGDLPPLAKSGSSNSYVVTLPLAANTRQKYIDLVVDKKTQQIIKDFSEVYARDVNGVPEREVIARIDELLHKLLDLSDLPPFFDSLPAMAPEAMMKHAVNTNSKFSFVYELLNDIAATDRNVLILGRKGVMNDYLEAVVSALNMPLQRFEPSKYIRPAAQSREGRRSFTVLLADTAELAEAKNRAQGTEKFPLPQDFDIVIGFDHTARTSGLIAFFAETPLPGAATGRTLDATSGQRSRHQPRKPLALLLVSALTLEHVDLRLELDSVDDLERKNALLLCTLESLTYLKDSPYEETPDKPHQVAEAFAKIILNPAATLDWQPTPLPEDVFDIYMNSSGPSSQPIFTQHETISGGLSRATQKRLFQDSGDDDTGEDKAKRARLRSYSATLSIVHRPSDHYSNAVKRALAGLGVDDSGIGPTVAISLTRLEALAAKVAGLEEQLQEKESLEATLTERVHTLNRLVKGQTATINECQTKLLAAVKERGVFERERDAAVQEVTLTKEKLESRTTALAELRAAKKEADASLAAANALAAGSSQPDVAELGAARVALQEAHEKVAALERKASNNSEELEFARRAYQDASNAAAEMSAENRDLSARVKELDRLAADNLRKIRETQNRNELEAYRQQWTEAMTMLGERERELEIARDELRTLKNGRRETRQCSVPRSPRLGVMGSRTLPGRGSSVAVGSNGGGTGVSSGRGNTPILPSAGADFAAAARASASRGNSPVTIILDAGGHGHGHSGNSSASGSASGGGGSYLSAGQSGGRFGHLRD
ncbi:hypothetical protein SEPCBS119000_000513 [Sporothrix epigloea]|uniref:Chromo domain-containing protein n=1 Tax=Sporothrix epigloea TaxID=1892477 RepID=A0ABP0D5I8_9PEZI